MFNPNFLKWLRRFIVKIKMYINRFSAYLSVLNTMMIGFVLLSSLEQYGIDIEIKKTIIPLAVLFIAFMILFGFLEVKLGFYEEEKSINSEMNPYFREIIERLKRLEEK